MQETSSRYIGSSFLCSGTGLSQTILLQLEMGRILQRVISYPFAEISDMFFNVLSIISGLNRISFAN